jgi:hypothetical protein
VPGATSVMTAAYHEAGHAVVAVALGTTVKLATLRAVTTMVRRGCPRAQYNEAVVALAGPAAETRYCGYREDEQTIRTLGASGGETKSGSGGRNEGSLNMTLRPRKHPDSARRRPVNVIAMPVPIAAQRVVSRPPPRPP